MDVRIGVTHTPKEIEVELADGADADAVAAQIEQALAGRGVALADRPPGPAGRHPLRPCGLRRAQHRQRGPAGRLRRRPALTGPDGRTGVGRSEAGACSTCSNGN